MLIDSHSHIDSDCFADMLPELFERMKKADVAGTLIAGCSLHEYERGLKFTQEHANTWYAVGVHPSTHDDPHEASIEELVELSKPEKIVAIGECGLDYYYEEAPYDDQKERFARHVEAAKIAKLPLIIHSRDAKEDTMDILRSHGADQCGFVLQDRKSTRLNSSHMA